jgi:hypothetical protein
MIDERQNLAETKKKPDGDTASRLHRLFTPSTVYRHVPSVGKHSKSPILA